MFADIAWLIAAAVIIDGFIIGLLAAAAVWVVVLAVRLVRRTRARRYVTVPIVDIDRDGAIRLAADTMHRSLTAAVQAGGKR
ncbi:hypothetical protein K378_01379 [Streptomyces sp. Amel2xB2]|uniref:hypothetical protein n=1 Tax=Streptomyces sp. Amel2xB2 TaxID=1305829 RepID=UPI000DB9F015|nr:hypothetical protein [Streptomyces sp. Amel2xB2]RAJ70214.1 hypothetical protein K378_01379 [Streptomyces sp. Amel2xB2]